MSEIEPVHAPDEPTADEFLSDNDSLDDDAAPPHALRGRLRPIKVLVGVMLLIGVSAAGVALYPYVAPTWIAEGPLVQQPSDDALTLVWFTSKSTNCDVEYGPADKRVTVHAEAGPARRQMARLTGIPPHGAVDYSIREGERVLGAGVARTTPDENQPFSFIVFGDSGRATSQQYELAKLMEPLRPDFLLHTGDLVYPSGARSDYREKFFRPYANLLKEIAFWPCVGNHDVAEESHGAYQAVFELPPDGPAGLPPDFNYWFDTASARIIVLDSNVSEADLRDWLAPWIEQVFSAPPATGHAPPRWRFVSFHHPPHTIGKYGDNAPIRDILAPVFEKAGVDVVFSGHDHLYERTVPLLGNKPAVGNERGVVYIVTGAGGAQLYKVKGDRGNIFAATNDATHSFTLISIAGDTLRGRQIGLGNVQLDEWTIHKN